MCALTVEEDMYDSVVMLLQVPGQDDAVTRVVSAMERCEEMHLRSKGYRTMHPIRFLIDGGSKR